MKKTGTTTTVNISHKKRDKDPIRNKNGEEINKIKFSDDDKGISSSDEPQSGTKSEKDGATGKIAKENQINKPSDNNNILSVPGKVVEDTGNIGSESDAQSPNTGKEGKKQKTLKFPGGTKESSANERKTASTSSSAKAKSDSGSGRSKSSDSSPDKGSYVTMDYNEYSKDELYQRAQEIDLEGRSQMNKDELVKELYETHTKAELYDRATHADISGRSKMSKTQLINALQRTDNDKSNSKDSSSKSNNTNSSQNKSSGSNNSGRASSSTGTDYQDLSRDELYEKAKQKDIEGRSQMNKDELIEALYADHTREDLYKKATRADITGRSKMSKKKLIKELQKS